MFGFHEFVDQRSRGGEMHAAFLAAGRHRQPGAQMGLASPAQNKHILLSFQVQLLFTTGGIRCSARSCFPNDCIAVQAAREAWCVYCRRKPGLWCRCG